MDLCEHFPLSTRHTVTPKGAKNSDEMVQAAPEQPSVVTVQLIFNPSSSPSQPASSPMMTAGDELPEEWAASPPAFPQPEHNQWARYVENATLTYNFCISPLTPLAVRGVVWIPGQHNIGADVARYAPALNAYAGSFVATYGQKSVPFIYAQPSAALVEGVSKPRIQNAVSIEFDQWPKSLRELATELGALAAKKWKR